jgi:ABC-2 type transport system permease protein
MNTITPKLKALLKAEWQHSMTYPGMIIIWVFDMFFIPLIFLLIWRSIVNTNPALQANESSITLYYILMPLVSLLTSAWHAPFFANDVRDGRLSTRLLKPLTPHAYTFIHSLTEKMVKMLFLLPMVVIGIIAYPISIDFSISTFLLCVVSVILGGVIKYLIE